MNDIFDIAAIAEKINSLIGDHTLPSALITLSISLVGCFLGYKLMKIYLAICGFLLGFAAGAMIGAAVDNSLLIIPLGILLAIAFAALAYKVYKIGVFLGAFFLSGMLTTGCLIMSVMKSNQDGAVIIGLAVGLIVGIIAVKLSKPMIIILSSISFGSVCGNCLSTIINVLLNKNMKLSALFGLIFIVLGIIVQIKTNDGLLEHPEREPASKNYAPPQYVNPYAAQGQPNPKLGGQAPQDGCGGEYLGSSRHR